jgi:hypothetical protein
MWAERVKKQNEDLKTDRVRDDLQISLTDKEYEGLKSLAYKAGFKNAGELLSSFVGDLTGWGSSNGSDERDCAERYYKRAFYLWEKYFIYHLYICKYDLADMKNMLDKSDFFEEVYEAYQEENVGEHIESKEECLKLLKEIIQEGKGL